MNRLLWLLTLTFTLAVLLPVAQAAATTVALADTPAAVQKAITARVGDGKLTSIDKTVEDGQTTFDVEMTTKDGQERDFSVNDGGTLVSVGVALNETPAAVQKAINTLAAGYQVESIDKNLDDTEITYDVMVTKDGREKDFTVAEDGTLLSMAMTLEETPAAVQKTIQAEIAGGRVTSIDKVIDDDGVTYDVEATAPAGRPKEFTVGADGKLVSVRVTLAETTPGAQRTIKEKIGNGKILRIDKSFVETKGVQPYEVQGQKDGKPFDFSVGPKGRFLGMDE